jgi:hypothetical protein
MKNIILIIFLFFIYGCGYTSVYKNLNNKDLQIDITKMEGDREMNNLIKNELNLYSNNNSINLFKITVTTKYQKIALAKDSTGVITDYKLSTESKFTIFFNNQVQLETFSEYIIIKDQADTFEQDSYEKNIKRNFASSIREKLISKISSSFANNTEDN